MKLGNTLKLAVFFLKKQVIDFSRKGCLAYLLTPAAWASVLRSDKQHTSLPLGNISFIVTRSLVVRKVSSKYVILK